MAPLSALVLSLAFTAIMSSVKAAGKKDENKMCPGNKGGNDTVRMTFLNDHNKKARGLEPDPLSPTGFAPKAIRMQKMIYDCEVEASAMKHAQKCEFKHSHGRFGENLFKIDDTGRDQAGLALWVTLCEYFPQRKKCDFVLYSG
ncbi:hypothetical protein OESDEN_10683 [Oesophagostomum dentatum]|uniref:SCP domain-containing protein n=1 Tax=Oesophagostomum dentatum TaxID=61180 RepID=A0A0B1SZZ3_OESDE|nr:hypothetical protein OESDEN_10683 [Oesophagostomum dentatum]